ncbi:MAG: hypothetical protein ACE5R5_07470 [Nitrosarchaeum sp.]
MVILTDKIMNEILNNLDSSVTELANGALESLEFQGKYDEVKNFLSSQYDIRLQKFLGAKNTDIHHLESGMKNKIIQRKQKTFENISKLFQN